VKEREIGTGGPTLGDCVIGEDDAEDRMIWLADAAIKARALHQRTERMIATLTPREREILEARFGRDVLRGPHGR
jgi:DNA-directed RNA polymerase sigma subunit (sigma70/sigma32)